MESRKRHFERAMKVLRVIAEADNSDPRNLPNKYDICKSLRSSGLGTEPTFLAAIDELEEAGLIYARFVDTHARGGSPSKHYDLTLKGLEELIGGINELGWKKLGFRKEMSFPVLARRYTPLLPEVFGLWGRYQQHNVADIVQRSLLSVCSSPPEEFDEGLRTLSRWKRDWLLKNPTKDSADYEKGVTERWRQVFLERLFLEIDVMSGKRAEWRKALKRDSELAKAYLACVRRKKADWEQQLKSIEAEIRELETDAY